MAEAEARAGIAAGRVAPWTWLHVRRRAVVGKAAAYLVLGSVGAVQLIPFFWMVSTSLKPRGTEFLWPPQWLPNPVVFRNYLTALTIMPFMTFLRNTLLITTANMVGGILTSLMAAYSFARLRFPYKNLLFSICLSTMMLPGVVTLIPQFIIFRHLGWVNTPLPLIVPNWFGGGAFFIFLGRQFFSTIPMELEDAARIDGATSYRIWWSVMLPLCKPVIASMAIFSFQWNWNDFMGPLVYLHDTEKLTMAVGLNVMKGVYQTDWNLLMAASTVFTIPMIILFFLAQREFMRGIVTSGLAGR
jgi:ABC-type glycerol-3-phosphate transport system permease component